LTDRHFGGGEGVEEPTEPAEPDDQLERAGIDDRPLAYGFLLGYIDLAFRGTQEYAAYQDLMFGPWEEVDRPRGGWGLRQWRRSVEDRKTLGPSNLLGTILIRMDFRDRTRPRKRRSPAVAKRDPNRIVVLRVGTPRVLLAVDADDEANAQRLLGLAREVCVRFKRQLD
jgi:hypothetical protein